MQDCLTCEKQSVYDGKCILCEKWLPGEQDKKVPVFIVTLHYPLTDGTTGKTSCVHKKRADADEDVRLLREEENDASLEEGEMTQGELDSLGEFDGW